MPQISKDSRRFSVEHSLSEPGGVGVAATIAEVRVVYYTHPAFFAPAAHFAREMSHRVELHLMLELSPGARSGDLFELDSGRLPSGLLPADALLAEILPPNVREYWREAASFHLVVHRPRRSIHPRSLVVGAQAARFIRGLRPDVVHFDDESRRMALPIATLSHLRIALSAHDPQPHSGEGSRGAQLARRLMYPHVGRFILHSRSLVPIFCRRYRIPPGRVAVTHLGAYRIATEWISKPVTQHDRTILFFGRVSRYKGLEVLYESARLIAARVRGVRLVIAGRPVSGYHPPRPPRLPNDGSIRVIEGFISSPQAAELFQMATVVACPYLDATQSGVVLTAYGFGRAVVATHTGGLPEYVEDEETGLLVPPGDAEALADALIRILADGSYRRQLEAAVRSRAQRALNWQRTGDQILGLYQELLAS